MIKIGILGASAVAPYAMIEPVGLREDCEISAIACRSPRRGKEFARQYGIPLIETEYEALVHHQDVDLVYNTLPPSHHAALSIAALNAGKPVLCEKPFAMNATEARRMVAAASKTGVPLIEAMHYRFHPAFIHLQKMLSRGDIGEIMRMHAIFVAPVPYREGEIRHTLEIGGGSLMDMGCYPVHWSRTIMNQEPIIRSAHCETQIPGIDITTRAQLEFENGVISDIECSMDATRPFQAELTIWGTTGRIRFDNPLSPHMGHLISLERDGDIQTTQIPGRRTYDYQLEHTLDVVSGRVQQIGGGADAIANMAAIDAIYETAGLPIR